ncbi:uncharacterized protein LOC132043163 [Lycium ferocissimum]|uniref:uncharacterized protein LOC132043163 n=1 Tax=Lycium ferocissimum TaxID=112874 RepID=UPI0028159A2E|nr:uncharacterized protein LOC132043163 [Lycium ferocissimum]XP_059289634.1 uncharacterized protein LOC132043163 [Lycium ferocissimum]
MDLKWQDGEWIDSCSEMQLPTRSSQKGWLTIIVALAISERPLVLTLGLVLLSLLRGSFLEDSEEQFEAAENIEEQVEVQEKPTLFRYGFIKMIAFVHHTFIFRSRKKIMSHYLDGYTGNMVLYFSVINNDVLYEY